MTELRDSSFMNPAEHPISMSFISIAASIMAKLTALIAALFEARTQFSEKNKAKGEERIRKEFLSLRN